LRGCCFYSSEDEIFLAKVSGLVVSSLQWPAIMGVNKRVCLLLNAPYIVLVYSR